MSTNLYGCTRRVQLYIYIYMYVCVFFNLKRIKLNILEATARYAGLLQGPAEGFGLWTRGWGPKMWIRFSCCKFKHFVMHFGIFNIFFLVLSLYLAIKKIPHTGDTKSLDRCRY